jgi:hypothetical protein
MRAGVAKLGSRRRSRKPLVTTPQEFKSPPQRNFHIFSRRKVTERKKTI